MAHKKGQGSSRNGRDSNSQRLGVKVFGGEFVTAGSIIVRQVGSTFHAGKGAGLAKDYSVFALRDGYVKFEWKTRQKQQISIYPAPNAS
jgi:large subunit ribosomal protein L27